MQLIEDIWLKDEIVYCLAFCGGAFNTKNINTGCSCVKCSSYHDSNIYEQIYRVIVQDIIHIIKRRLYENDKK